MIHGFANFCFISDSFHMPVILSLLETITAWEELAINLGIHYDTVRKIEVERRGNVDHSLRDVIHYWLLQRDDVKEMGGCTKQSLIAALQQMDEIAVANEVLGMVTSSVMCSLRVWEYIFTFYYLLSQLYACILH